MARRGREKARWLQYFMLSILGAAIWFGRAAGMPPEEFKQLPEDRRKAVLLECVERNLQRYANVSMKTTTHIHKAQVNVASKKVVKLLDDFGLTITELRRLDDSYRMTYFEKQPPHREIGVCHYDAESNTTRSFNIVNIDGKGRLRGTISRQPGQAGAAGPWGSYLFMFLGGLSHRPEASPKNDFLDALLQHQETLQIRDVDCGNHAVEARFTYTTDHPPSACSCIMTFDPDKDWMLTRMELEESPAPNAPVWHYSRFEVHESQVFDGVWLPTWSSAVLWSIDAQGLPVGKHWEMTSENITVGRMKPNDLEATFPPGTLVYDDRNGKSRFADKSGKLVDHDEMLLADEEETTAKRRPACLQQPPVIATLAGLAVVLTGVLGYRRIRRGRDTKDSDR